MRYIGSKNKISKHIAPIIQKSIDDNNIDIYYEPFVGGANMIDKIYCKTRIGNDIHKELISMWQEIQGGWEFPMHISEEEYLDVKNNKSKYPDCYVGLVGFAATFGAKYFGGYARSPISDGDTPRDRPNEALRNIKKQVENIKDVNFICGDYRTNEYADIENAVIYCDPPYKNTTSFSGTDTFNHDEFWDWVREKSKNNIVFVSEYSAPADFECIWLKETLANFDCNRGNDTSKKNRIEKLFKLKQ